MLRFECDHIAPSGCGDANQEGIDSYVLFGSNTTHVWTGSPQVILKICLTTLIRIRSTSALRGVTLWFKYDQRQLPNELGTFPIKWVSTTMFSLVRIRPMFEQEAPKWPWDLFNDVDSYMIHVGPKGVKLWFKYDQEAPKWVWQYADQVGIDSYVLLGSNTTYVWTGSPQVMTARFRYDHKPDQRESQIQI